MRPRRARATALALAFASLVGAAGSFRPLPAVAAINSVSPSGATVQPGQAASATVSLTSSELPSSCVTVESPHGTVSASVGPACGSDQWQTRLTVSTTGATPAGTYGIRVVERDQTGAVAGTATFSLRVASPAASTTTSTKPPTTSSTTKPTTTSTKPTTTMATSTSTTQATTTAPSPAVDPGFTAFAVAAGRTLSGPALFLPLEGAGYASCVPLDAPCTDPDFELTIVPASDRDVVWVPAAVGPTANGPASAVDAVGTAAPDATGDFLVPGLDARPAGGALRLLPRQYRAGGRLVATEDRPAGSAVTTSLKPPVPPPAPPLLAATLFDAPRRISASDLADARPAVVVFGPGAHVVMGIVADADWQLDQAWLPLVRSTAVARFGRAPDGRVGLALPIDVAAAPRLASTTAADGNSNWQWLGSLLFGLAAVIAGAGIMFSIRRR